MLLNRDDQAGFKLDSTYTHKTLPTLSAKPSATTQTDFLNKYSAQLQVTSYNFSETSTSDEVCIGIVKASGLHEKSPSQRAADLQKVEKLDVSKHIFLSDGEEAAKEIECVRVDGGADEGPVHHEVQFLWTERHVSRPTKITMVTATAKPLFHQPSGSPFSEGGGIDKAKYKANMSAALISI